MSFALTKDQILDQTKTVTRRNGWLFLKPYTQVQPVEKCMGLKKGEKQKLLGQPIDIISVSREPLNAISQEEVIKEGFPDQTPEWFIYMYCKANRCTPDTEVTRIEFMFLPF
jgi:hypothetical protein